MKQVVEQRRREKEQKINRFREWSREALSRAEQLSGRINLIAAVRVAVFILAAGMAWYAMKTGMSWMWGGVFLLFIGLLWLVRYHQKILFLRKIQREIVRLNEGEILSLNGDFSPFRNGMEYAQSSHPFALDIDLFGDGSLFPFLNRTVTHSGEKLLAERLGNTNRDPGEILRTQAAVKELAGKVDFRQRFYATGCVLDEEKEDEDALKGILGRPAVFRSFTTVRWVSWFIPAGMIVLLLLMALNIIPYQVPLLYLILPATALGIPLKKINRYHNELYHGIRILKKYQKLLNLIETQEFVSDKLRDMQADLRSGSLPAAMLIKKLLSRFEMLEARRNFFVGVFLNLLLLWDFHSLWWIQKWISKYSEKVGQWFQVLSEMDMLSSLASFSCRFPEFTWPSPKDQGVLLETENMGHPMIDPVHRIDNDFILKNQGFFYILTGPNMAGKSTFLRSIGVNIVLAHAGGPVCADNFSFRPHRLYTSMRTTDSLKEQTSYFYAELRRLRKIMDALDSEIPVVVLLDEILKGTNSKDKSAGSIAVIRKMIARKGSGVIATHDLTLSVLEQEFPDQVKNICFEATREGDLLKYDYQLRPGVAKNMNATLLMEQMGIIDQK